MRAIPRSVSVLCALWCAFSVSGTSGEYRHHRKCSHLKHEFFHQNLGDRDLIYDIPTHDPAASICYDGSKEPHQSSCCSAGAEAQYLLAAKFYFKTSIWKSFSEVRNISTNYDAYESELVHQIRAAREKTAQVLTFTHKVPEAQHRTPLSSFFQEIEEYVRRRGQVSMDDAINEFFSSLFPAVYSYVLSDRTLITYSQPFLDCLQQNQEEIAPFGNEPHRLKNRLTQTLSRSVAYMNTLSVMMEALNQSQPSDAIDPECLRAVARLRYCGHCHGHLETPVCHGFCLNVLRGCLADVSEISSEWDELVKALEMLGKTLQGKFSTEDVLAHLDRDIADAILQAMDDGRRISTMVKEKCPEDHGKGDSDYKPPETQNLTPRPVTSRPLAEHVAVVLKELKDTRGLYSRLADIICRNASLYEQDMRSEQCWNGTAVAQYMRDVPEANVISQARFNQELSVTVKPNYRLLQVREKLTHARKNLTELLSKGEQMLGDRPSPTGYGGASGDGTRNIVFNEVDDEDLFDPASGMTSGDYSGDYTTHLPPVDTGIDRVTPGRRPPQPGDRGTASSARTAWSLLVVAMATTLAPYFLRV